MTNGHDMPMSYKALTETSTSLKLFYVATKAEKKIDRREASSFEMLCLIGSYYGVIFEYPAILGSKYLALVLAEYFYFLEWSTSNGLEVLICTETF